jgi:hypothetical protein
MISTIFHNTVFKDPPFIGAIVFVTSSLCIQTGSGAHPASYLMGTERGKARPGRDADHSPPSSAEVKYE